MSVTLPKLPYAFDALEPYMSERTLQYHYGKHHKSYVEKTNAAIAGSDLEDEKLENIIRKAAQREDKKLFNNAAQVWNHTFFWNCMKPGANKPEGKIAEAIMEAFGDFDSFKDSFIQAAVGQFGSGWAWLVTRNGSVEITTTANAETPVTEKGHPLLTCDVWEHAYYLDYQNERGDFVESFLENLVNWDFVTTRLSEAVAEAKRKAA